ncbi:MAG: hypothetical protein PF569_01560 [Candidatus Woesearchaeota archaeon]|jgi:hypothetical protein|nr:hypothetical protein [Candidatus Woesearchaeota archaeon]
MRDFKTEEQRKKLNLDNTSKNERIDVINSKKRQGKIKKWLFGGAVAAIGVATITSGGNPDLIKNANAQVDNDPARSLYINQLNEGSYYNDKNIQSETFLKEINNFLHNKKFSSNHIYSQTDLEFYGTLRNILLVLDNKEERYLLKKYNFDISRVSNMMTFYKIAGNKHEAIISDIMNCAETNLKYFLKTISENKLKLVGSFDEMIRNGNVYLINPDGSSANHLYIWRLAK